MEVYCNTLVCIAEKMDEIVLQEGQVYCNRGSLAAKETILQYSLVGSRFVLQYKLYCELGVGLGRDTARAGAGRAQLGATTRPGAQQAQAGRWGAQAAGARRRWGARGRRTLGRRAAGACNRRVGAAGARHLRATGRRSGRGRLGGLGLQLARAVH